MNSIDFHSAGIGAFFLIYLAGLATSLTPCVYPLIPIVIGYLGSQTGSTKRRLAFTLSYVLGLSLCYSALGLVAALTGRMFGEMTMNTWVNLGFGILILILSGNMMDWYQLPIPSFLQPKAGGGAPLSLGQAFVVGVTSGLVASPCTAPVLAGLLLFISTEHSFIKGGLMMFTFSIGMNTLFIVLGLSAGFVKNMPRSGAWMVVIKKILAYLMIASGLYFVYRAGQLS